MPTPNAEFDQYTGLRSGDIKRILIAALNRMFDPSSGLLKMGAVGATNVTISQATLSTSAQQILSTRTTRRSATIKNLDGAIKVYIGHSSAVTSSNGMELKAGESWSVDTQAPLWAIAASGSPIISIGETYD